MCFCAGLSTAARSWSDVYKRQCYGRVELAPMMACIIIAIIPIIILYMTCQKYIIEGVVAGAVKG